MNELIKVNYENTEQPTVSGRELHEALGVKTEYKDWFPRMCDYGFADGVDFNTLKKERVQIEGSRNVTRTITDHQLTVDMAKEICMIQRSDKGKAIRQYFISIEKQWNTPEAIMARALQIANTRLNLLEEKNQLLEQKIEEDKPFTEHGKIVSDSTDCVDFAEFAKITNSRFGLGRNRLFEYLRNKGVLTKDNIPYQRFINAGLFKVIQTKKESPYGTKVFSKTIITGKGQHELIKAIDKWFMKDAQRGDDVIEIE